MSKKPSIPTYKHQERPPFFEPSDVQEPIRLKSMADRALDKIMEDLPTSPVSPVRSASPASPLVMDGIPVFMGDLQDLFDSLPPLTPDPTDASAFDLDGFVSPDVRPSPSPSPKPPSSPTISPQEMEKVVSLDEWRPGQGMIIRPIPLSEIKQWPRVEIRQYYETMNRVQNKYGHESELEGLFKPTVEEIGKLLHWDAPKTNNEIRAMGRDELLDHLNELKEINTQEYSKTGERKINYKIGLVEERLKELSEEKKRGKRPAPSIPPSLPPPSPLPSPPPGPSGIGNGSSNGSPSGNGKSDGNGDGNGDDDDDDDHDDDDERHKNADQDSASKAMKIKLGKGDYQTIARTTTVTTVRRGKRPVVNREHTSTTLPNNDDEEDDDDNGATISAQGVLKRKRKSRSPKTKSRRKKVSQRGGGQIESYIRALKRRKRNDGSY